jgi:hypothetical protein
MDDNKPVQITMSGKLTFSEEITLAQAAQIVAFLDQSSGATVGGSPQPSPRLPGTRGFGSSTSPRDALEASGAKTNPEKMVAFALHILHEGDKETFTLDDIKPLFRRARETAPANISRDLDRTLKAGWIAESDIKGEYYVTANASQVLESGFESLRGRRAKSAGRARSAGTRKPRKTATAIPDAFRDVDNISPTIGGLINYHKLKTKTDRFLWAVYAAKQLGVETVSNQDIVWLTDKLGDGISAGEIAGNFRQNNKVGYVNKSMQTQKIRILPEGEEYLKSKAQS